MAPTQDHKARLLIRPLQPADLAGVAALSIRVYGSGYSQDMVRGQLGHFPECTENTEQVAFADLRLDTLVEFRANGTVLNLKDRRHDLYQTSWAAKDELK